MELGVSSRLGEAYTHKLVLEVQGKYSNIFLVDHRNVILACGYQVIWLCHGQMLILLLTHGYMQSICVWQASLEVLICMTGG